MSLDNTLPSRYSGNIKLAILSLLNSMGAINHTRAISINDIARHLNIPLNLVEKNIRELLEEKYLGKKENTYYISDKGIAVIVGIVS